MRLCGINGLRDWLHDRPKVKHSLGSGETAVVEMNELFHLPNNGTRSTIPSRTKQARATSEGSSDEVQRSGFRGSGGRIVEFDVPRKQRLDVGFGRSGGKLGEELLEVRPWLEPVGLGGLHQAVAVRTGLRAVRRAAPRRTSPPDA